MRISPLAAAIAMTIVFGLTARPAQAYIDPGTGSSLFSSLGVMLGAVVTMLALCVSQFRRWGGWLRARYQMRHRGGDAHAEAPSDESAAGVEPR